MVSSPKEHLMSWLRDAHAMEKQSIESTENQLTRLEHYPELRSWVQDHVEASKRHRERVRECIERNGGSTSTLKDVAMTVMGNIQAFTGLLAADEVLKNVIADYAFKHYQIACYTSLNAGAKEAGDEQTAVVCEQILEEDRRLAERILPLVSGLTRRYAQREAVGAPAGR